jgi:hypothetical protein
MAATADAAGGRRLSTIEDVLWYGLAAATYVGLSVQHKALLNWVVGPLWLVAFVWVGPAAVDLVRGHPAPGARPR